MSLPHIQHEFKYKCGHFSLVITLLSSQSSVGGLFHNDFLRKINIEIVGVKLQDSRDREQGSKLTGQICSHR